MFCIFDTRAHDCKTDNIWIGYIKSIWWLQPVYIPVSLIKWVIVPEVPRWERNSCIGPDLGNLSNDRILRALKRCIRCSPWIQSQLSNCWCGHVRVRVRQLNCPLGFVCVDHDQMVRIDPNKNRAGSQRLPCMLWSSGIKRKLLTNFPTKSRKIAELTCEWIQSVLLSRIELSKNASKSKNTSFDRSRYLAGWWGMIDAKSRFRQPSLTNATDPIECGSSGSGDTCSF